jgi:hypothetical protein
MDEEKVLELIQDATVLNLKKGDSIIIKVKDRVPAEMVRVLEDAVREKMSSRIKDDIGIIVIDSSADVSILRKEN